MTDKQKTMAGSAFIYAIIIGALIFLPFVIFDRGYFIYYGDFNVQQIPFYKLAHEAVRSGDIFWNWHTDLGVNFIGSYSFYLLFSPFFWLTLPFPTAWLPFMMAPLLVLKTACASFFAYFYLARFLKDSRFAVVGSLLYAFSGWMDFNIFFNHFHDVAVFFPLLLYSLEVLVHERRRGLFAVCVLINAMVNYWFFIGEVVFVIIYFFVRLTDKNFKRSIDSSCFFSLLGEAILGVFCASFVLLPSAMALMGNPRTGANEIMTGWNFWLYWHEQRPAAIIESLFMPPDLPARPNFFPDHGAKWSSLSAWLPMLSLSGVLAYIFRRKNDWLKKILITSFAMAMIPGLNSLFILLNNSYYARWFYMPILLMALASMRAIEDSAHDDSYFKRSLKWCALVCSVFVVASGLTPNYNDKGELVFGMAQDHFMLWMYAAFALGGVLLTYLIVVKLRHDRRFIRIAGGGIAIFSIAFTVFFMFNGKNTFERSQFVINTAIKGRELIDLPDEQFARADAYDAMDNLLMFWGLPNIQAFHSIVPPSIMEFYPKVGVTRDVGSRPEADYYALRPLLSVKWLFIQSDKENQDPMPGYSKYAEQAGFSIYENRNFIPMGFAYDKYLTYTDFDNVQQSMKDNVLLKAIVLDDGAIRENSDILTPLDEMDFTATQDMLEGDCAARSMYAVRDFKPDRLGFSAISDFGETRLIFFSVPWEGGWSASVNGKPAEIYKANIGFMAVRIPAGQCDIRFDYMTPGLIDGVALSLIAAAALAAYAIICKVKGKTASRRVNVGNELMLGHTVTLNEAEFKESFGDKDRMAELQRTLNEAAAVHIDESLPEAERTLKWHGEALPGNAPAREEHPPENENPLHE